MEQVQKGNSSPIAKPIDNSQAISLLLPTRGRPDYLKNVLDSLEATTEQKNLVDVWVYVDKDDDPTALFMTSSKGSAYSFKINWVVGERTIGQGEMATILWHRCTTNPGIYLPTSDKHLFVSCGWDRCVREAFARHPDGILLAYPHDPTAGPDQVTISILGAAWVNTLGRVHTQYFPFWFDDSWMDQVSQMVQRKTKLDIRMEPQGGKGKTGRMRNLLFWQHFFDNTLDDRIEEANRLRKQVYREESNAFHESTLKAKSLIARWHAQTLGDVKRETDRKLEVLEWTLAALPPQSRYKPDYLYLEAERQAVRHLLGKVEDLFARDSMGEALVMLDNVAETLQIFEEVQYLRAICLWRLGRKNEARRAALAELKLSPRETEVLSLHSMDEYAVPVERAEFTLRIHKAMDATLRPVGLRPCPNVPRALTQQHLVLRGFHAMRNPGRYPEYARRIWRRLKKNAW